MKPLFVLASLLFFSHLVYSQTPLKILPSPTDKALCPLNEVTHSVVVDGGGTRPTCTYRWSITGGTITSATTGHTIRVKWNDQPGKGTLTVVTSNCKDGEGNSLPDEDFNEVSADYVRLSVFGQSFPTGAAACSNSTIDVPLCSNEAILVCADKMYIKDTGGINQPPLKEVDAYVWTIPSGWRQQNTTTVGPATITTTANSLVLEPVSVSGGTVSVVGTVRNTCGQIVANSNPKTITLRRTPSVSLTSDPVNYIARCGLKNPVSFTVTPVACATSYTWDYPFGWSPTISGNTIKLTPNGSNGGTVSVAIALSTGYTFNISKSVPYSDAAPPSIQATGPSEVCSGESKTFTTTLPSGYPSNFGFDWYASSGVYINGTNGSNITPVHTSTNSATITIAPNAYGMKRIYTRVNNLACTPGNWGSREIRAGVFNSQDFYIVGPSEVCPNTVADYHSSYISADVTNYQWSAPYGWSSWGNGSPYFSVSVPWSFTGGEAITLRLGNRCGTTNTPYVLWLSSGYCGYSVSPNPASSTLTVNDLVLDEGEKAEATLMDKNNNKVMKSYYKDGKIEFDVSNLPNGQYVVTVKYKDKIESKNVIIKH